MDDERHDGEQRRLAGRRHTIRYHEGGYLTRLPSRSFASNPTRLTLHAVCAGRLELGKPRAGQSPERRGG
jgi:hypothetical protein